MRKLRIIVGTIEIQAELFDTPTADAIYANAPFTSSRAELCVTRDEFALLLREPLR